MPRRNTPPRARTEIQPDDEGSVDDAVNRRLDRKTVRRIQEQNQEVKAIVRGLIDDVETAIAEGRMHDAVQLNVELFWYLWKDPQREEVTARHNDIMDTHVKARLRRYHRVFTEKDHSPPPDHVLKDLQRLAKAEGYINAVDDKSRYAEVTFSRLDAPGVDAPSPEDIRPVGRLRVGSQELSTVDERAPVIDHADCEHVLAVALPRQGKDSTLARLCGNLKDQHGYKWFSCFDDGRNETPMTAIPTDDPKIRQNLERFGQTPKAYDTAVFVPATKGVPDELPGNFVPFTIGLDDLTPKMILRLAGVTTEDPNSVRRVGQALRTAREKSGSVEDLIYRLQDYAEETEATITVMELADDEVTGTSDGGQVVADADAVESTDGEVREQRFEMPADDVLEECAQALMMLSGEGLLADANASTNIDMEEEFRRDRVAVLNCNFLEESNKPLQYIVLNLWLRLIYRAREENSRLPRAVVELRELKNICPSVLENAEYPSVVKPLRNTLYFLATQGGSRRVMIAGSTQKLNHVYKAVRTNMPVKILLQLGDEEILTLDRAYNFSDEQKRQLAGFDTGTGMLLDGGSAHWPIEWAGARCGLGDGDQHWLDRYGRAYGARVRKHHADGWADYEDAVECWVDMEGRRRPTDDPPEIGDWYLLPEDFPGDFDGDEPGEVDVEAALAARREYEVPNDLRLQETPLASQTRELTMRNKEKAEQMRQERLLDEHDVPDALYPWVERSAEKRDRMVRVLRVVRSETLSTHEEIADAAGYTETSVSNYLADSEELRRCVQKQDGSYQLTGLGDRALDIDWDAVVA